MEFNSNIRSQIKYPLDAESKGALKSALEDVEKDIIRKRNRFPLTIPTGATSFVIGSDYMEIRAQAAVTINRIYGGREGQVLTAQFLDTFVTISDTQGVNDGIELRGPFVSDSTKVLELLYNGLSWFEVGRNSGIVSSDFLDTTLTHRLVQIYLSDTLVSTGDSQFHFFIPPEMDSWSLIDADAGNATPSTTGNLTIQIRNGTTGNDMLSTKITIDTAEPTSYTAATPPVINTANDSVVTGDRITIDIDSAGTSEGISIMLTFKE